MTDEFELQLTKTGDKARNWMTMSKNWLTKDEVETSIRTFQSVQNEIGSTFSKIEWRDDENRRENLYYDNRQLTPWLIHAISDNLAHIFQDWRHNEPNDANGREDCMVVRALAGGTWNDVRCQSGTYRVMCMKTGN